MKRREKPAVTGAVIFLLPSYPVKPLQTHGLLRLDAVYEAFSLCTTSNSLQMAPRKRPALITAGTDVHSFGISVDMEEHTTPEPY